jgi:hypothetical protein
MNKTGRIEKDLRKNLVETRMTLVKKTMDLLSLLLLVTIFLSKTP